MRTPASYSIRFSLATVALICLAACGRGNNEDQPTTGEIMGDMSHDTTRKAMMDTGWHDTMVNDTIINDTMQRNPVTP